jgi:hypothetical protein
MSTILKKMKTATLTESERACYHRSWWSRASRHATMGETLAEARAAMAADGWVASAAFEFWRPGFVAYMDSLRHTLLVFKVPSPVALRPARQKKAA